MPRETSKDYRAGWADHATVIGFALDLAERAALSVGAELSPREAEFVRALREIVKRPAPEHTR